MTGFEWAAAGRLLLAVLLGGLIGAERQIHGRPAGLRTHILVCAGSALIMIVGQSLGPSIDPGRAVAGIVTGIGFLGAGVIVKSHDIVRGLTTAACIWFVAALGIAIGQGLYVIAAVGTVIGLIVLTLLAWFAHRLPSVSYHTVTVRGAYAEVDSIDRACREMLAQSGYRVVGASAQLDKSADVARLAFRLRTRNGGRDWNAGRNLLTVSQIDEVVWD